MADYFKAGSFYYETYGSTWHRNDDETNPITKGMSVLQAMKLTGINKIKVDFADNIKRILLPGGDTVEIESEKKSLVMLNVPWMPNGIQDLERDVKWYKPIQNADYAKILDTLTEKYQVSSVFHCGPLGENLIIQFEVEPFYVQDMEGEMHQAFLTVAENRKTGKKYFGFTMVRVVCQNTFNMAINAGLRSMPNSDRPDLLLDFQVQLEKHRQKHIEDLNKLFTKKVDKGDEVKVANELFQAPAMGKYVTQYRGQAEAQGFDMTQDRESVAYVNDKAKQAVAMYDREMARRDSRQKAFFAKVGEYNDLFKDTGAAGSAYVLWQAATDTDLWRNDELWRSPDPGVTSFDMMFGDKGKAQARAWAVLNK